MSFAAGHSMPGGDALAALHNSGPGPMSVYRTAPVGSVHVLDLFTELQQAPELPRHLRKRFTPRESEYFDRLPSVDLIAAPPSVPGDVLALVRFLLAALTRPTRSARRPCAADDAGTERDALDAIGALTGRLEELGCLSPVPVLVAWLDRCGSGPRSVPNVAPGERLPWLPRCFVVDMALLRLAWIVVAFSHAAPPLLLFSRPASLRFWRPDGALSLRWLMPKESIR
jgi:hypothetical protein